MFVKRWITAIWIFCLSFTHAQDKTGIDRLFSSGQYDSVVACYRNLSLQQSLSSFGTSILHKIAKSFFYIGQPREALQIYQELTEQIPQDHLAYTAMLMDYALVLTETGQYRLSDSILHSVKAWLQPDSATRQKAEWYNRLGVLRVRQARYQEAKPLFDTALCIAVLLNDTALLSVLYTHMGMAERETGYFSKALGYYQRAWMIDSLRQNPYDLAVDALNIANVYNELGQFRKSLRYYEKAESCYTKIGDTTGLCLVYANKAVAYEEMGELSSSQQALRKALSMDRGDDLLGRAGMDLNLGILMIRQNEFEKAIPVLDSAYHLFSRLSRPVEQAYALCYTGRARSRLQDYAEAESNFREAIGLMQKSETPESGWIVYYEYARSAYHHGNITHALTLLDTTLQLTEKLRIRGGEEHLLTHFFENEFQQAYRFYAYLLIQKGCTRTALQISEKIKTRLIGQVTDTLFSGSSLSPVIRYFYYDSLWFAFMIKGDFVHVHPLKPGNAIPRLCADYYRLLSGGVNDERLKKTARKLYAILLQPLLKEWPDLQTLTIVPDGYLYYVPFETLIAGERYLIEDYPVRYLPSVESEKSFRQRWFNLYHHKLSSYLFFQSDYREMHDERYGELLPDLPSVIKEREHLQLHFRGESVHFYADPVFKSAVEKLNGRFADIVHIAAHAIHHVLYPEKSGLVFAGDRALGEDGFLTADEISRFSIQARLVVLSACQTSLGELLAGEGMTGLTRAFLVAGAASVISTLWKIEDLSAALIMERFYYYHKICRESVAKALQKAKSDGIRSGTLLPHQWGAYVLWGAD